MTIDNLERAIYKWKPKNLLCYTEANAYRKKHPGGSRAPLDEFYVDQTPIGLDILYSTDIISFKGVSYQHSRLIILAECSKCGATNHYLTTFWYDEDLSGEATRKLREAEKSG